MVMIIGEEQGEYLRDNGEVIIRKTGAGLTEINCCTQSTYHVSEVNNNVQLERKAEKSELPEGQCCDSLSLKTPHPHSSNSRQG